MGPLSAVAVAFWLLMAGATDLGWWTVASKPMGWISLVVLALVLLDAFVIGSVRWGVRYARRTSSER